MQFDNIIYGDMSFLMLSMIFVWVYMRVHTGWANKPGDGVWAHASVLLLSEWYF